VDLLLGANTRVRQFTSAHIYRGKCSNNTNTTLKTFINYCPALHKNIPVGARFFAYVQTGPGAHPASCTMGTGSFPGVKRPGRGADHPPLLAPRSRKSRAIPLPPSGLSSLLRGTFTLHKNVTANTTQSVRDTVRRSGCHSSKGPTKPYPLQAAHPGS
jgi:hypothetical protein